MFTHCTRCLQLFLFDISIPKAVWTGLFVRLTDQTFQTKIVSYQTFQTEINTDQTFQTQVTSDQTFQTQGVSDQTFQTEDVLIRPSSDHGPDSNSDHCSDLNQTLTRLKRARNRF